MICNYSWEQRKLESIADVLTGGEPPLDHIKSKEPYDQYKYPIYSNGLGDDALWGYSKEYRIDKPAITFSSIGSLGSPELRSRCFTPVIRLKVIIPKDDKTDLAYLKYNLDLADFSNNASGIPNINADSVKAISFMHTQNRNEQVKIGNLFLNLDNLITLHHRKFFQ